MPAGSESLDFFHIFGQMWIRYVFVAWPFALTHLFLLIYILFDPLRPIKRETRSLAAWKEGTGSNEGTECTTVLDQFVSETKDGGKQGVLIPMTDFSDRLDSRVSALIDGLHSRINLFLIIGIAGTFFALFTFALLSGQDDIDPQQLARNLNYALAHAFPVGFFGLLWTMIGHFVALGPERRLRSSLTSATKKALKTRQIYMHGPGQVLTKAVTTLNENIDKLFKPVQDLQGTLRETLKPVIASFEKQLKDTSGLLEEQHKTLQSSVESVQKVVGAVDEFRGSFREVVQDVSKIVDNIELIQSKSAAQIEATQQAIGNWIDKAEASMQRLVDASEKITALPERLNTSFAASLKEHATESHKIWDETNQTFLGDIQGHFLTWMNNIEGSAREANESLAAAARELQRVSTNVQEVIRETADQSFKHIVEETKQHLGNLDQAIASRYPQAVEQLLQMLGKTDEISGHLNAISRTLDRTVAEISDVQRQWSNMVSGINDAMTNANNVDIGKIRVALEQTAVNTTVLTQSVDPSVSRIERVVSNWRGGVAGRISNIFSKRKMG